MQMANTLAYCVTATITVAQSVIMEAPGIYFSFGHCSNTYNDFTYNDF
jgi:hypothetical protein